MTPTTAIPTQFAAFRKVPGGYRIIAAAQYPDPIDSFLYTVLAQDGNSYVRWTYNAQAIGYSNGHYFVSYNIADADEVKARAWENFNLRVRELNQFEDYRRVEESRR